MKFGLRGNRSWRIWLRNQNTEGRAPIPGKDGGCPIKEKHQALDPPPEPAAQSGWGRDPIRIQAVWRGSFEAHSVREPLHGFLAGRQAIRGTRNTPGRQHREGTIAPVTFSAPDPDPVMFTVVPPPYPRPRSRLHPEIPRNRRHRAQSPDRKPVWQPSRPPAGQPVHRLKSVIRKDLCVANPNYLPNLEFPFVRNRSLSTFPYYLRGIPTSNFI